jgi:hypothetical protein
LRKGKATAAAPWNAGMDFYQIIVTKGTSIRTGRFHNGQMQLLIHKACIRITQIPQKRFPSQLKEVVIAPMINSLSYVYLEKGNPERCLVPGPRDF